jgi:hypothetical protein
MTSFVMRQMLAQLSWMSLLTRHESPVLEALQTPAIGVSNRNKDHGCMTTYHEPRSLFSPHWQIWNAMLRLVAASALAMA